MLHQATLLERTGRLTSRDRLRDHPFDFTVPKGADRLDIGFRYRPGRSGAFENLLVLSLFDPHGFRGARHRWDTDQRIAIGSHGATPGFLRGPLAQGRWRLEIHACEVLDGGTDGCEYTLAVRASLGDGQTGGTISPPDRAAPEPAPVNERPGWYRGDLHSHSWHCDGESSIGAMARAAAERSHDFLATTGHNTIAHLLADEPWPAGLLRIRGIECTTYFGHANALGVGRWIDWRTKDPVTGIRGVLEQTHAQGGLLVVNHPAAAGNPACTGCRWEYSGVGLDELDAIEVWNGPWALKSPEGANNPAALALWTDLLERGQRVPVVGGGDTHAASEVLAPDRPVTWVRANALAEREILAALRGGRSYISVGPRLGFTARTADGVTTTVPGTVLPAAAGVDLRVDVTELSQPATLWAIVDGEPRRLGSLRPPAGTGEARPLTPSRWWRLEIRAGEDVEDELLALTNPIFHDQAGWRARPGDSSLA